MSKEAENDWGAYTAGSIILTELCIISVVNAVVSSWLKVFVTWTCAVGVLWIN